MPNTRRTLSIFPNIRPHEPLEVRGLGGINNSTSEDLIEDHELSSAVNIVLDQANGGVLRIREGFQDYGVKVSHDDGNFISIYSGLLNNYLTVANGKIYTFTTSVSALSTELNSGLVEAHWTSWKESDGTSYDLYADNVNNPQKNNVASSGGFSAIGGSPPVFRAMVTFHNMVFGIVDNTLRWSSYGNFEDWPASNSFIFDEDPNAIFQFRDVLIIFFAEYFVHVSATNALDVSLEPIRLGIGCTSQASIVEAPTGLYWWSNNGLVWSPDGVQVREIAKEKISTTIDSLNRSLFHLIHGIWNVELDRLQYHVALSGESILRHIIYYYPRVVGLDDGAFFFGHLRTGAHLDSSDVFTLNDGTEQPLFGGFLASDEGSTLNARGGVKKESGSVDTTIDDNEAAISGPQTAYYDSKVFSPGGAQSTKRLTRVALSLFGTGGQAPMSGQVALFQDYNTGFSKIWSSVAMRTTFSGTTTNLLEDIPIGYRSRYRTVKVRVYAGANPGPTPAGITFRAAKVQLDGYYLNA